MIKVRLFDKYEYKVGEEVIVFLGFGQSDNISKSNITDSILRTRGVKLIIDDNKNDLISYDAIFIH